MKKIGFSKLIVLLLLLALAATVFVACNKQSDENLPTISFKVEVDGETVDSVEEWTKYTGFSVSADGLTLTQELRSFSPTLVAGNALGWDTNRLAAEAVTYDFYSYISTTKGSGFKLFSDEAMTKVVAYTSTTYDLEGSAVISASPVEITENQHEFWMRVYMLGDMSLSTIYHIVFNRTPYTVTYNTGGDPEIAAVTAYYYDLIKLPNPEKSGYAFDAWYSDAGFSTLFTGKVVQSNVTVYARFVTTSNALGFSYITSGGNAVITGLSGENAATTEVTVPETLDGKTVSAIAPYAFANASLTKITLGANNVSVGANAFSGDSALTIEFDSSYTYYTTNAEWAQWAYLFRGAEPQTGDASGLHYVTVGTNAVVTGVDSSLTSVTVPATLGNAAVVAISEFAFKNNSTLTSLTLSSELSEAAALRLQLGAFDGTNFAIFASHAFRTMSNWADYSARIWDGSETSATVVTTNGEISLSLKLQANSDNTAVSASLLGITVAEGASSTVLDLSDLEYELVAGTSLPVDFTTVGEGALRGNTYITSVVFPSYSVLNVGANAFRGCTALTTVTNAQYGSVGESAFRDSAVAGNVAYIGTNIPAYAFAGSKITGISAKNVQNVGAHAFDGSSVGSAQFADLVCLGDYAFANSAVTSFNVIDKLVYIGAHAFENVSRLTSVAFGDSLVSVGGYAFAGTSVSEVNIGENLFVIGEHAFDSVTTLTKVTVADNAKLSVLGDYAFNGCTKVAGFPIKNCSALVSIGKYAFYNLGSAATVSSVAMLLSNTVVSIGDYAFYGNSYFTSLKIFGKGAGSLTEIGAYSFMGTKLSGELVLPAAVSTIGNYAFSGLAFSSLTFAADDKLTSIGAGAFQSNNIANALVFPSSLETIGSNAFYGNAIPSVTFGSRFSSLGNNVFSGCTKLSSVVFPEDSALMSIGSYAFKSCSSLEIFTISANVKNIGTGAFYSCKNLYELHVKAKIPPKLGSNVFALSGFADNVYDEQFNGNKVKRVYVPAGSNALTTPYVNSYRCPTAANTPEYSSQMDGWKELASYIYVEQ